MKKITGSLLLMLLAIAFTGCDKEKSLEELIIGKWEIKSMTYIEYKNNVKIDEEIEYTEANESVIEVKSDGTGTHSEFGTVDDQFTWSIEGSTLTINPGGGDEETLKVSIDGDAMSFKMTDTEIDGTDTYRYESTVKAIRINN